MATNTASSSSLRLASSRSVFSPSSALPSFSLPQIHRSNCRFRDPYSAQFPRLSSRPERASSLRSHAFPRRKQQQQKLEEEDEEEFVSAYRFPDPIPEFAEAEMEKFRAHLLRKFSKKTDLYGDKVEEVLEICTEIFSTFLNTEYGGPGTLLVTPFMDMADALNDRGLPGSKAARTAVKWAQQHVDEDWKEWTRDEDEDEDEDEDDDDKDEDEDDNEND